MKNYKKIFFQILWQCVLLKPVNQIQQYAATGVTDHKAMDGEVGIMDMD